MEVNKALKGKIVTVYGYQYKFARALDVNETVISRVLSGKKELTPSEKRVWAEKLETTPDVLFPDDNGGGKEK